MEGRPRSLGPRGEVGLEFKEVSGVFYGSKREKYGIKTLGLGRGL